MTMLSPDVKLTSPPVDSTATPPLTVMSSSGGGSVVVVSLPVSVVVAEIVPALVVLTANVKGLFADSVVVVPVLFDVAREPTAAIVSAPVLAMVTEPAVFLNARLETAVLRGF